MLSKQKHKFWTEAKHEATALSTSFGWAWVIRRNGEYEVAAGELQEEAPKGFSAEFKDGYEQ